MKIAYPATIEGNEEDSAYIVDFPDLEGCFTFGETLEEAKNMASEALTAYLESVDSRKVKINTPSKLTGNNIFYIEPDKKVGFAVWLKSEREHQGLTQVEFAKKLGVRFQTYQRIENPIKTNPTLTTIIKLEKALNKNILHV